MTYDLQNNQAIFDQLNYQTNANFKIEDLEDIVRQQTNENIYNQYHVENNQVISEAIDIDMEFMDRNIRYRDTNGNDNGFEKMTDANDHSV
jgi:hypothetical protein